MKLILLIPTLLNIPYPGLQYEETAKSHMAYFAEICWQGSAPGRVRTLLCYSTFLQRPREKETRPVNVHRCARKESLQ